MEKVFKAVNWNSPEDNYSLKFWEQNFKQIWSEEEIPVSNDKMVWFSLDKNQKDVYKKVLAGLTLLDTEQSGVGMPLVMQRVESKQKKAVLSLMGMMESVHAKSYSYIFTTLCKTEEINYLFKWVEDNKFLQLKVSLIDRYYTNIITLKDLYLAMVASVYLESFLFYSSFFYPLYLAGQGKMTDSGDIINLILRDESIHGLYIGVLAQEIYNELTIEEKNEVDVEIYQMLDELYANEVEYTKDIYDQIGLSEEVLDFIKYNANKALQNLGRDEYFEHGKINPIVENGLKTVTKQHDFFSKKSNGYMKAINIVLMQDEDFDY